MESTYPLWTLSLLGPSLTSSLRSLFLFEGTVRENASPWEDAVSDHAIIQALERVDLWGKVTSLGGLGAPLDENLLSHGQRQLFCLARALLREKKYTDTRRANRPVSLHFIPV